MKNFTLNDGTNVSVTSDKLYRIGLHMPRNKDYNDMYIETFYMLSPTEIKKHIKKYDGVPVYIVEM
jgi:hypothetical protein